MQDFYHQQYDSSPLAHITSHRPSLAQSRSDPETRSNGFQHKTASKMALQARWLEAARAGRAWPLSWSSGLGLTALQAVPTVQSKAHVTAVTNPYGGTWVSPTFMGGRCGRWKWMSQALLTRRWLQFSSVFSRMSAPATRERLRTNIWRCLGPYHHSSRASHRRASSCCVFFRRVILSLEYTHEL